MVQSVANAGTRSLGVMHAVARLYGEEPKAQPPHVIQPVSSEVTTHSEEQESVDLELLGNDITDHAAKPGWWPWGKGTK